MGPSEAPFIHVREVRDRCCPRILHPLHPLLDPANSRRWRRSGGDTGQSSWSRDICTERHLGKR
jgi:hypothetical protein